MGAGRFYGLEAARGVAAAMVAIYHASAVSAGGRHTGVLPFAGLTANFGAGVDFFFVLSGFAITWHYARDRAGWQVGTFLRRRFLRIYPLYWAILAPLCAVYLLNPSFGAPAQHDPWTIALGWCLIPQPAHSALGVSWTLTFEVTFYVVFAAMVGRSALGLAIAGTWLMVVALVALVIVAWAGRPYPPSSLFNPRAVGFLFGIAGALFLRRRQVPTPRAILAAGLAVFITGLLWLDPDAKWADAGYALVFGGASAAIVPALVELERSGHIARRPIFLAMGACSFAIYLVHGEVESFAWHALAPLRSVLSADAMALGLAGLGIAAGVAVHYLLETHLDRKAARLVPLRLATTGRGDPVGSPR